MDTPPSSDPGASTGNAPLSLRIATSVLIPLVVICCAVALYYRRIAARLPHPFRRNSVAPTTPLTTPEPRFRQGATGVSVPGAPPSSPHRPRPRNGRHRPPSVRTVPEYSAAAHATEIVLARASAEPASDSERLLPATDIDPDLPLESPPLAADQAPPEYISRPSSRPVSLMAHQLPVPSVLAQDAPEELSHPPTGRWAAQDDGAEEFAQISPGRMSADDTLQGFSQTPLGRIAQYPHSDAPHDQVLVSRPSTPSGHRPTFSMSSLLSRRESASPSPESDSVHRSKPPRRARAISTVFSHIFPSRSNRRRTLSTTYSSSHSLLPTHARVGSESQVSFSRSRLSMFRTQTSSSSRSATSSNSMVLPPLSQTVQPASGSSRWNISAPLPFSFQASGFEYPKDGKPTEEQMRFLGSVENLSRLGVQPHVPRPTSQVSAITQMTGPSTSSLPHASSPTAT